LRRGTHEANQQGVTTAWPKATGSRDFTSPRHAFLVCPFANSTGFETTLAGAFGRSHDAVWLPYNELELQRQAEAACGKWNPHQEVLELPFREVLELGLTDYIME
jgi:hypothetical protein